MNTFLYKMAIHLRELRELMNWKQEDLAKHVGISRPSLIAIEKEGEKLDRTVALAIFSVVASEIAERREKLESLSFLDWTQPARHASLIGALGTIDQTGRFFGVSAALFCNNAITSWLGITGLLGAKLASFLSKPKTNAYHEISPEQFRAISQNSFNLL